MLLKIKLTFHVRCVLNWEPPLFNGVIVHKDNSEYLRVVILKIEYWKQ